MNGWGMKAEEAWIKFLLPRVSAFLRFPLLLFASIHKKSRETTGYNNTEGSDLFLPVCWGLQQRGCYQVFRQQALHPQTDSTPRSRMPSFCTTGHNRLPVIRYHR